MTNRVNSAPFLPEAPIYDKIVDSNGKLSTPWFNWFNSVTRVTGYVVTHARYATSREETPLIEVISFETTALRDDILAVPNGTIGYNKETGRFNFREGGAWVTFTPVAA